VKLFFGAQFPMRGNIPRVERRRRSLDVLATSRAEFTMSHERNDDFELTRREALLAAGAGGFSLMGICNACMAAEDKMIFGESTPTKNISKLAPDNAIIKSLDAAAAQFKNGNGAYSAPRLSHEQVVSRIQEVLHSGEAASKLGRNRSVVRVAAASLDGENQKSKALAHFASQGFSSSDLKNAEVFFTRSSLLDQDKITSVKSLPVSKLTEELDRKKNLNVNTLTAVSYDQKAATLNANVVLNGDRGALQISFLNFAVTPEMENELKEMANKIKAGQQNFIDPPQLSAKLIANVVSRVRLKAKIVKLPSSSGNTSSGGSSSGDSSTSTELTPTQRMQCFTDCISNLSNSQIASMGGFCAACATAIGASAGFTIGSGGTLTAVGIIILSIAGFACLTCISVMVAFFVTCHDLCFS